MFKTCEIFNRELKKQYLTTYIGIGETQAHLQTSVQEHAFTCAVFNLSHGIIETENDRLFRDNWQHLYRYYNIPWLIHTVTYKTFTRYLFAKTKQELIKALKKRKIK
jgi:hypothetical protein